MTLRQVRKVPSLPPRKIKEKLPVNNSFLLGFAEIPDIKGHFANPDFLTLVMGITPTAR